MTLDTTVTRPRLVDLLPVLAVTALAVGLRLFRLDAQGLWGDEINMVRFATGERPLELAFGNALGYVWLLRGVSCIGHSELLYRLPAALFGAVTIPALYLTGSHWWSRPVGLTAALLLALAPLHVAHSQEVHSYALFCLLALLSFDLMWRGLEGGGTRCWVAFGVISGVAVHVHLYAFFVLGTEIAILLVLGLWKHALWRPATLRRVLGGRATWWSAASLLLLASPVLWRTVLPMLGQLLTKVGGGEPTVAYLRGTPRWHISARLLVDRLRDLVLWWHAPYPVVFWAASGLFVVGLGFLWVYSRPKAVAAAAWVAVPLMPIAVFSRLANLDFSARRLIFLLPIVLLVIAGALIGLADGACRLADRVLRHPTPAWVWQGLVVLAAAAGLATTALRYYYVEYEKEDYRGVARLLAAVAGPDDIIVSWRPEYLSYYYHGQTPITGYLPRTRLDRIKERFPHAERLWYVRPVNLTRIHPFSLQLEGWLHELDAFQFLFSPDLVVSVAWSQPQPSGGRLAARLGVLEAARRIKGDRWYLRERLEQLRQESSRPLGPPSGDEEEQ